MKKLLMILIAGLMMTACSSEDEPTLSGEYLETTTWDAVLTGTQSPEPIAVSAHFVMQFLTTNSGQCIPAYDDYSFEGNFTYRINKDMITFNGSLTGNWTVVEQTSKAMILQSFQPKEWKLVLTKK